MTRKLHKTRITNSSPISLLTYGLKIKLCLCRSLCDDIQCINLPDNLNANEGQVGAAFLGCKFNMDQSTMAEFGNLSLFAQGRNILSLVLFPLVCRATCVGKSISVCFYASVQIRVFSAGVYEAPPNVSK